MELESAISLPHVLLGAHTSTAGGAHKALERGKSIGCTTVQVFVKNANQWFGKPLASADIEMFRLEVERTSIRPVVAHAAYLINLCATNSDILTKSRNAYTDELRRCEAFGIKALIFHPGAHMGAGEDEGIKRIAESINMIHSMTPGFAVLTTLEGTAGQGSTLGYRFEHLRSIIDKVDASTRMGVCLDTCHLYAAGYTIGTEDGWQKTIREFNEIVGLERLIAIHVNDSKHELGSRRDRHDHIGQGRIGLTAFRMLMNDSRLSDIPKILETEKSEDMHEDVMNMNTLRSLVEVQKGQGNA